ncbi:MAG: hypothetical protein U0136_13065 [Bdellovibrionota bacterium]
MDYRSKLLTVALSASALLLYFSVRTPLLGNGWSVIADRGFFIPAESSAMDFRVTQPNEGSGEWWIYGEDSNHFYALDEHEAAYYVFSKEKQSECRHFSKLDRATWCAPSKRPIPPN